MGFDTDCRGQSETLAIAIVLVLALTSALLIAGIGSVTIEESQRIVETERNVQVLTELDSKASLVALEGGDSATLDVSNRGDGTVTVDDGGRLRLNLRSNNTTRVLTNTTLGTVTYGNGDQRIAYQGGGVWRRNDGTNGSVMVSPPEVHYETGTLTLPMIQVTGGDGWLSTARMEQGNTTRVYPNSTELQSNPVPNGGELTMLVTSDYYRAWGAYFEERFEADVTTFDGNRTVRVRLEVPESRFRLGAGLVSVGTGDRIEMSGNAGNPTFVDSYNSSQGPYHNSSTMNGTVRGSGGIKLGGNSFIKGTADIGGEMSMKGNNNTVYGDVWHQGLRKTGPDNEITGDNASNGTGVDIPSIDSTVNQRVNELCSENATSPSFESENDAAEYCIDGDLDFQGADTDTLTFDLSEGNVSLAVTGDVDIGNGERIEVTNTSGHSLKLWLGGQEISIKGTVTVPKDRSPAVRVFGGGETQVSMNQGQFTGLLYAPGSPGSGGHLSMNANSSIYGSAVVPAVDMHSGSAVHYDKALGGFSFDRRSTPAAELSYFYVTINEVRIEGR